MNLSLHARNFIAILTSNFAIQALRFLTITILSRRLGAELFGAYNYIVLLVTYGLIVVEFGLKNLAIREFAQNRGSRKLVRQIFKIRLFLAVFALAMVLALSVQAFGSRVYLWPAFFIGTSLFTSALFVDYILIANESLVAQAAGNVAQALVLFVGCLILVRSPKHFLLLNQLYFLSNVVWAGFYFVSARKHWPEAASVPSDSRTWRTALNGAPFMIALLVVQLQFTMDLLLLGQFHHSELLGPYSAALKVVGVAVGVVYALIASVQPRLAKQSSDIASAELGHLVHSTTRFLWLIIAPTVVGCWLFGDQLVVWIFGTAFAQSAVYLKPLSLVFAFWTLSLGPVSTLFVSTHTKAMLKFAFFNFFVTFIFVGSVLFAGHPQFVPWAMAAAEAIYLFTAWAWFGRNSVVVTEDFKSLALPVLLLALPLLTTWPAPFKFALAATGYVSGLVVLKVWSRPWFNSVFGRA